MTTKNESVPSFPSKEIKCAVCLISTEKLKVKANKKKKIEASQSVFMVFKFRMETIKGFEFHVAWDTKFRRPSLGKMETSQWAMNRQGLIRAAKARAMSCMRQLRDAHDGLSHVPTMKWLAVSVTEEQFDV